MKICNLHQRGDCPKIYVILLLMSLSANVLAQPEYPGSIQQYIAFRQPEIALTHCALADVVHKKIIADQTIVISHGLITAIGNTSNTPVPAEAMVIDATGKSVLPGFVMLHEHMFYPASSESPYYIHFKQLPVTFPRLYLACGVTTIRTAGSIEPYSDLALKQEADSNRIIGPDMWVTAPYLEGTGGFAPQMHPITNPDEARQFVNFWSNEGFTSFKAYMNLDLACLKAAIETAHAKGLKMTAHLCAVTYREAADLGIDQLEHGFLASTDFIPGKKANACALSINPLSNIDPRGMKAKAMINLLVSRKVILTSTLAVFEGMCNQSAIPTRQALEAMSPDTRDMYERYYSKERSGEMDSALTKELILEKEFSDAGGLLTAGTDPTGNGSVLAGYGSWRSIEMLTKAGFTPIEAIRIATYNGAVALGIQAGTGSIDIGKRADLVIVDGNIAQNIDAIENVKWVFHHGVAFDCRKILQQMNGQVGKY